IQLEEDLFGQWMRPFNRFFDNGSNRYQRGVSKALGKRGAVFTAYAVLLLATGLMFQLVPRGFIPVQDKGYIIAGVKMPEGASIERTDAALEKIGAMALEIEGTQNDIAFPGFNPLQFINTPNYGVTFINLKPFGERSRSAAEINAELNARLAGIQEGFAFSILPPPIQGLGNGSGYSFFIEDRGNLG